MDITKPKTPASLVTRVFASIEIFLYHDKMKLFIILNLFVSLSFANEKELGAAVKYVKAIITKSNKTTLKTKGCSVAKDKWLALLLTREAFSERISYNKTCDLNGNFKVQMAKFFKVPLMIRDKKFKSIDVMAKIDIAFKDSMVLTLTFKDGVLTSHDKKKFHFKAKKEFSIDPLNQKDPIKNSKDGTLEVSYKKSKKSIKI